MQGILCYRLIKLGSVELVENRRTRAADGPVIKQYTSFSVRVGQSPSNAAFHTWNYITPVIRLSPNAEEFKREFKKSIYNYFVNVWTYETQFKRVVPV